jgi:catechol 2,3-dioxygenase-like lactoylglutathione lyase family enzyme
MSHPMRRIDHVVVAVRDLDLAGAFYQRLGFQVGARNRHPWGTENRLIQFGTSFIELIAIGPDAAAIEDHAPGRFSFGGFVRDYLRQREGFAMLVLDSDDAKADAALFSQEGLGSFDPFFFERKGRRPDGSETHVAFTLAFATDVRAPRAGFFVCQQHFPENFWNPVFQQHENGATAITSIGMIAADPKVYQSFLSTFSGSPAQPGPQGRLSIELRGGRLVVSPDPIGRTDLQFDSITIRVRDITNQAERLTRAGAPFKMTEDRLCVLPEAAFGLTILFDSEGR